MKKLGKNKKIRKWFVVIFCCSLLWVILFGMQNCVSNKEGSEALLPQLGKAWGTRGETSDEELRDILEGGEANGKVGNFEFVADSTGALREYTNVPGTEPILSKNNIRNPMLFLELQKAGRNGSSGAYKGRAVISYHLNDELKVGSFYSAYGDVSQNRWELTRVDLPESERHSISYTEAPVWIGFFQDSGGAIILITDHLLDYADGGGYRPIVSGSVWFKNFLFPEGRNTQGPSACWKISAGPYDCQARIVKRGDEDCNENFCPKALRENPYMKLGNFKDLNLIEVGFDINDIGGQVPRGNGSVMLTQQVKAFNKQVPRGTGSVEEKSFWSGILEKIKLYLRHFLKLLGFLK